MAGTGGNSTAEAIELSRFALKVGADCTLSVVPYYNKPSQEGIYRHFKAVAEAVDIPMVVYNVPVAHRGRHAARDGAAPRAGAGDRRHQGRDRRHRARAARSAQRARRASRSIPATTTRAVALMLLGGHGSISVTANVAPRAMHELCTAALAGNARQAARLQLQLLGLHQALFVEPSPAPTKWALARLGRCGADGAAADHAAQRIGPGRGRRGTARGRPRVSTPAARLSERVLRAPSPAARRRSPSMETSE